MSGIGRNAFPPALISCPMFAPGWNRTVDDDVDWGSRQYLAKQMSGETHKHKECQCEIARARITLEDEVEGESRKYLANLWVYNII